MRRWLIETATGIGGRAEQQDRVAVLTAGAPERRLVVVADGMGGLEEGAWAAQTVVDVARREFRVQAGGSPRQLLERICRLAHRQIAEGAQRRGIRAGSTCVALFLDGDEAYWIHVGDSRLYHFRGAELSFSTDDHTLASLTGGENGAEAAPGLYACLGAEADLVTEFGATALGNDDGFLLCSDGLWSQVAIEEMATQVSSAVDREGVADALKDLALGRAGSGSDNVTLAVVRTVDWRRRWAQALRGRARAR